MSRKQSKVARKKSRLSLKVGETAIVRHAKQHELDDLEREGFQVENQLHHPVMRAYGSAYVWRKECVKKSKSRDRT